jgi:hypothetical protein
MFVKESSSDVSIGTVGNAIDEVLEKRKELVWAGRVCVGSRDGGRKVVKPTSDVTWDGPSETAGMAVLHEGNGCDYRVYCGLKDLGIC